jgi:hypothetical protein
VQALPVKLWRDSLPAHTDQTRFLEGEAGNRAQPDSCYELTLAREFGEESFPPKSLMLIGGSDDETDSKKATYARAGRNIKIPD